MTAIDREAEVASRIERRRRAVPRFTDERVTMAHGAGGKASRKLVEGVFVRRSPTHRSTPSATPRS